jgi:ABC-type transport system involved in multi-copper enzyme maturation permease subunit
MRKLLRANFARLKKDKVFWICMAFMFAAGIFGVVQKYINDPGETPDQLLFIFPVLIGIVTAAFSSLFIGTEYSDGTIRNKIVVGQKRSSVYLSNFITCSAAGIIMCLSYIAAVAVLGFPLLGLPKMEAGPAIILLLVSFMMVITCAALFTLLCMLNQNKAISAVICIIMIVTLLVVASLINSKLDAPQFYDSYKLSDSMGNSSTEKVVNPDYLTGTEREAYQFMLDFLPTGQAIEITSHETPHLWQMPLYSLLIVLASTVSGVLCFRKKDLK